MASRDLVLDGLNTAQHEAVTAPLCGQLQILAGPGTGKTKTLTARVANLMRQVPPDSIVVMTFTNHAASEMKLRIAAMVDEALARRLQIGTFHSVAYRYLVKYGTRIGLKDKLKVADTTDQTTILRDLVASGRFEAHMASAGYSRDSGTFKHPKNGEFSTKPGSIIHALSQLKSRGFTLDKFLTTAPSALPTSTVPTDALRVIYPLYQAELEHDGLLDFDDILLRCRQLLQEHPDLVKNVNAVLVDEFQDSNGLQLELTTLFAQATNNITVVGDPDQSIYAFRNAQPENITTLATTFPGCKAVYLEENYRSSQQILDMAIELIRQDSNRIHSDRSLRGQLMLSTKPSVVEFKTEDDEARSICNYIKALVSNSIFEHKDVAILARTAYASKKCELHLASLKIPYRVLGGNKFWDQAEIRLVLDYLRVVVSDSDRSAILRTINVPKRGFGGVTLQKILARSDQYPSIFEQLRIMGDSPESDVQLRSDTRTKLATYISLIDELRGLVSEEDASRPGTFVVEAIGRILDATDIIRALSDGSTMSQERREENIELLKDHVLSYFAKAQEEGLEEEDSDRSGLSLLDQLLGSMALGVEEDGADENGTNKLTISTIHSAKGLEWPVVFAINCVDENYYRCETDVEFSEERRLLFVAMTRAKVLLCASHSQQVFRAGITSPTHLSRFLADSKMKRLYDLGTHIGSFSWADLCETMKFLGRELPARVSYTAMSTETKLVYGGFSSGAMLSKEKSWPNSQRMNSTSWKPRVSHSSTRPLQDENEDLSVKRAAPSKAPVYVPQVTGTKKRLGIRRRVI